MLWEYAEEKRGAREFALPRLPITNGLWLPADKALCVGLANDRGLLINAQNVHLVESNGQLYTEMVRNTIKIPNRRPYIGELTKLKFVHKLDYAYLDFLGGMNKHNVPWIATEFSENLTVDATVCITQMLSPRNNPIFSKQDSLLRTEAGEWIRNVYGVTELRIQRILMLLHRIFRKWRFRLVGKNGSVYSYSDSVSTMLLLKLQKFQEASKEHQTLFPEIGHDSFIRGSELVSQSKKTRRTKSGNQKA